MEGVEEGAVAAVPESCWVRTTASHPYLVTEASPSWFKLWEVTEEEAVGRSVKSLLNRPGHDELAARRLTEAFRANGHATASCRNPSAKSGRVYEHVVTLSLDEAGLLGVSRQITPLPGSSTCAEATCAAAPADAARGSSSGSTAAEQTHLDQRPPFRLPGRVRCLGWENLPCGSTRLLTAIDAALEDMGGSSGGGVSTTYTVHPYRFVIEARTGPPGACEQLAAAREGVGVEGGHATAANRGLESGAAPPPALASPLLSSGGATAFDRVVISVEVYAAGPKPPTTQKDAPPARCCHVDVRRLAGPTLLFKRTYERFRQQLSEKLGFKSYEELAQHSPLLSARPHGALIASYAWTPAYLHGQALTAEGGAALAPPEPQVRRRAGPIPPGPLV